jgi:hypothetical protein
MSERTISELVRQKPLGDKYHRADAPPKGVTQMLPIGPFRMWLAHMINHDGTELRQVAELIQLNERTIRRILGTPERGGRNRRNEYRVQESVSLDTVDWALTKADGRTQLWHLYPELYDSTDSDIEISS